MEKVMDDFFFLFFFSETNVKKDDLRRVHLSYSVFEGIWCCHSKPHVQSTSLSEKCELEKKIRIWKRQKTKTFQMKHTELLEISLAIISIWKLVTQSSNHTEGNIFFFFFVADNLNTINLYVNIGQATISFFCHVIPISSIIWRCNALIGLFNPMKTFWVFQKYLLLHKYLCIHGCFSCHVGCFMILFTSVFWCIYFFTGSSASNRVQKIFDKIGYFSV